MSWGTVRSTGRSRRQRGTNPRALGTSPRCMASNPTAGTSKDVARVASTVRQAAAVADVRGDTPPATARAATMYLQANRMAGGPRPQRHSSPWGAWWAVSEREHERTSWCASFGIGTRPAGQLLDATAAELAPVELQPAELAPAELAEAEAEPP